MHTLCLSYFPLVALLQLFSTDLVTKGPVICTVLDVLLILFQPLNMHAVMLVKLVFIFI